MPKEANSNKILNEVKYEFLLMLFQLNNKSVKTLSILSIRHKDLLQVDTSSNDFLRLKLDSKSLLDQ